MQNELTLTRLAWASLLPFILSSVLGAFGIASQTLLIFFLVYSAVLLSFQAGVHWGIALVEKTEKTFWQLVLPFFVVFVAWLVYASLPASVALLVLAASHLIWLNYDLTQITMPWYERMRRPITFVIAGTHFIWFTVVMTQARIG